MNELDSRIREAVRGGRLLQLIADCTIDEADVARLSKILDADGRSLFHTAVTSGNVELCEYIFSLSEETVIHAPDDNHWTPLMSACSCNHRGVVEWLVSKGADVNALNQQKRNATFYACSKGSRDLVEYMLNAHEDPGIFKMQDSTGSTLLHRAVATGNLEAVKALVSRIPHTDVSAVVYDTRDAHGDSVQDICMRYIKNDDDIGDKLKDILISKNS